MGTHRRGVAAHGWVRAWLFAAVVGLAIAWTRPAEAEVRLASAIGDLTALSLDDLLAIEVTTVSGRAERRTGAAAAVYVVTGDELRRAGVTTLPEALRLIPGLEVARVDAHTWAISSRGFISTAADKLEVLMDGRSLYTPLFSGVFWEVPDTVLEDIARIEVIRGPGATLWGGNAINGVINIITKSAAETEGTLVELGGGVEDQGLVNLRQGWTGSGGAQHRVFAKYVNRDDSRLSAGGPDNDAYHAGRLGFRSDWRTAGGAEMSLLGEIFDGAERDTNVIFSLTDPMVTAVRDKSEFAGGSLLARWVKSSDSGTETEVLAYYDRTVRDIPQVFTEDRDTLEVEVQQRLPAGTRHELTWGASYRLSADDVRNTFNVSWTPEDRELHLFDLFLQDHIELVPDRFYLTVGSKLEHNDFTGLEAQPSLRVAWHPDEESTVWAAVSRAVRVPNRLDDDLFLVAAVQPGSPPTVLGLIGNDDFDAEELLAYELGWRLRPCPSLSLDIAAFYNDYDRLRGIEVGAPVDQGAFLLTPFVFDNSITGETYGTELSAVWEPAPWARLFGGYSYLRVNLEPLPGSTDVFTEASEGNDPEHQASLRASLDLPRETSLDLFARYVDVLSNQAVPSYVELDARLAWRPTGAWELAVVGHNLLDRSHAEFGGGTEIERSVFLTLAWRR